MRSLRHAPPEQVLADPERDDEDRVLRHAPDGRSSRCRGGRSGRARSAPRSAAAGPPAASGPGGCAADRRWRDGETRSLHTGSVSTQCPSISRSTVAWPSQVAASSPAWAGSSGVTTSTGRRGLPLRPLVAISAAIPAVVPDGTSVAGSRLRNRPSLNCGESRVVELAHAGAQGASYAPGSREHTAEDTTARNSEKSSPATVSTSAQPQRSRTTSSLVPRSLPPSATTRPTAGGVHDAVAVRPPVQPHRLHAGSCGQHGTDAQPPAVALPDDGPQHRSGTARPHVDAPGAQPDVARRRRSADRPAPAAPRRPGRDRGPGRRRAGSARPARGSRRRPRPAAPSSAR